MTKTLRKTKYFRVDLPVFCSYVEVIVAPKDLWGASFKLYLKAGEQSVKDVEELASDKGGITEACFFASGGVAAIFLKPNFSLNSLVHEAIHVGLNLLKDRGFQDVNTEAEAYLISYLVREIYSKTKKKGKQ